MKSDLGNVRIDMKICLIILHRCFQEQLRESDFSSFRAS